MYYEGTVEDVTEAVLAQRALQQSEERLKLLTSQVPGMVFVVHVDRDGRRTYRYVSSGVRDIYGFGPEDLMRDPMLIARYRHPDDRAMLEQDMRDISLGPVDLGGEFRVVLPDGQIKWVYRRSCTVSSDGDGYLRVGVLLDITERKQAEAALKDSEALWKLAMDSTGDGVWDWNLETGEEFFSDRILAMFGYADGDIANLSEELDRRTHPDDLAQMRADRLAHFEQRTPIYRNEHRVRCKDGSWKWVLSRGMVIARDDAGRPLRMVGTHTDITDFKQAEAHQRVLELQLRESQKMEAIGTLAGGVAHDFNNLLAAILGNLALAREDVGPDHAAQESLQEISRAAIRARQLVQQILTFSRRQTQEMLKQPLAPLLTEALGLLRALLPAGVRLEADLGDAPLVVSVDATQVQQILINLCTNAWQSMEGRPGEVRVGLRSVYLDADEGGALGGLPPGAYARLSVADTGPGMSDETRRRLFEPFFTTKPPGTGTGLGLSVVHGIVKAHRGAIDVDSTPGAGSRFDVYLPLAEAEAGGVDLGTAPVAVPAVEEPSPPRHIVYIDDYEAMVFLVGRLLRKDGFVTHTFESGEDALAWMQTYEGEIDLVVTDQNMPGLSGVEVARAIRRLRPQQRIAIVSGHVDDRLLAEAAEAGVQEVLGKQDSMDALGASIRQLLRSAQD